MTDIPSFDLLTEPWIPVLDLAGAERDLSVLEVFDQADELAGIGGELPTTSFALTRLLLAVLHRAVRGPRDVEHWQELWESPGLPVDGVRDYLGRWRDRWDLLHPVTPFMQVAGLRPANPTTPPWTLSKIIADVPNNNPLFTVRGGRYVQTISPAEAARWTVHAIGFDIAGQKTGVDGEPRKRMPNGNLNLGSTGWLGRLGGVFVEGRSVRDTLLLNLVPYRLGDDNPLRWRSPSHDLPLWERDPLGPGPELDEEGQPRARPAGPADLYSWPSRHLRWVRTDDAVTGVVLTYANPLRQQNAHVFEPMVAWRRSQTQEKALKEPLVYMPRQHSVDRVFWRGLAAVLPNRTAERARQEAGDLPATVLGWLAEASYDGALPDGTPVRTRVVGMAYGPQDSSVEEVVDDQISTQLAVLRAEHGALGERALAAVSAADGAVQALKRLAENLDRAAGGPGEGARDRAEEVAYAALDLPFRRWLADLVVGADTDALRVRWEAEVLRIIGQRAAELVEQCGPAAWSGRPVMGRHVDSGLAEVWFRTALHKALPYSHTSERTAS